MKKINWRQWTIAGLTLVTAALGLILRALGLRLEMTSNTGIMGNGAYAILGIVMGIYGIALAILLFPLENKALAKRAFSTSIFANVVLLLAAVALAVGNAMRFGDTVLTENTLTTVLNAALPYLGIASAVCIGLFATVRIRRMQPNALLLIVPTIYLVVWLVMQFQQWNADPYVQDYCYHLLSIIFAMLGVYELGGYCFDKGKRRITLFWTLGGFVLGTVTLADHFNNGLSDLLVGGALTVLMLVSSVQLLFLLGDESAARTV